MSDVDEKTLDEFFAKKSKSKKSKSKSKPFTTSKDIAEKKQKTKGKTEENAETCAKEVSQVEEQWKDFDAPQETDYTGLRVQSLQINEENEKEEDRPTIENTGEGETESKKESPSGPWVKTTPATVPAAVSSVEPETIPKVGGKYFPGAFKEKLKKERPGVPPDISSQAAFPSLSTTATDSSQNRGDFEMVKRGMKVSGTSVESKPSVNTENRYDSLQS